jgi:hypothetical protein
MPEENEQNKEHSRISMRIGEVQVELEGTIGNIKKLMGKELSDFTKGLQETTKQSLSSTEFTPKVTPKEKTVPPPAIPSTKPKALPPSPHVSKTGKITEKKPTKRTVSRTAVIALVIVCIVLSAGLVSVIAVYLPLASNLESQIAEKDNKIATLDAQVFSLNNTRLALQRFVDQTVSQLEEYNETIANLEVLLLDYQNIVLLRKSGILFNGQITQNATNTTILYNDTVEYAGYVTVDIQSTSNTTYAGVVYDTIGVNYDHNVTLGTIGAASFPVLPGNIVVVVGNTDTNISDSVNATVTATYYY